MFTKKVSRYGMGKILGWGVFVLLFLGTIGNAAEKGDLTELYEKAKKEGSVSFYASMAAQDAQNLGKRFEKKYPGIKVQLYHAPMVELLRRANIEAAAGRHIFDVIDLDTDTVGAMKKNNLLAKYIPSSFSMFPKGFMDPEGYWQTEYTNPCVISYNTKLVKPDEAPKTWEGLLDPKWKGKKIGVNRANPVVWWLGIRDIMGDEPAVKYLNQLAAQKVTFISGITNLLQSVSVGEFPLAAWGLIGSLQKLKDKGAPLEWVRMTSPVPTQVETASIAQNAPHPNAARLFYEFLSSKEGQEAFAEHNKVVVRTDVKARNIDDIKKLNLRLIKPVPEAEYSRASKQFLSIFSL